MLRLIQALPASARQGLVVNPTTFASKLANVLAHDLRQQLVQGMLYEPLAEVAAASFKESFTHLASGLVAATAGKTLYSHVDVDSSVERAVARALEANERVKLYVKLPRWFQIETPMGGYSPDWAILVAHPEHGDYVKLVRETKSTTDKEELRPREQARIDCGRAHSSALGVSYAVATGGDHLGL